MKISDLQGLLTKVGQYAQDAEIVLKDAESGAETVLQDVEIKLTADGTGTGSVVLNHTAAAPAPASETTDQEPAAPSDQVAQPAV